MRNYSNGLFSFLLIGLFSFSEGKPCPERTKPHKTRCDTYYKCTELAANKHVWVPMLCEEGLIYEHTLSVCVLPADDWECVTGTPLNTNINKGQRATNLTRNRDADIYMVSNAEEDDVNLNSKYGEGEMEIIIGPDISEEDNDEEDGNEAEELYDGSGNGSELVAFDGFMPAQTRDSEIDEVTKKEGEKNTNVNSVQEVQKMEQKEELEEMFQSIKIKAGLRQPATNIDPKLTAHLQRLSQLIDGLKQTYQTQTNKPQDDLNLRPDQLNAFLAHFNIRNKFDSLDPTSKKSNGSLQHKPVINTKLNPETKVVLSNMLPYNYGGSKYDNGNSGSDYSNSQIVINRPEGSVLFTLPEHHYMENTDFTSDNTPKISEETLKTVLELSKQMIAQQNVPKVIPSPTYFASPIMQPILLTPHVDSPFSTNYIGQTSNTPGFSGQYNNGGAYNQNNKHKKTVKKPHYNGGNNDYDNYETHDNNGYSNNKPGTTIIHNNLIPVHLTTASSGEKDILDSYGQSLRLYPPFHEDRPVVNSGYHGNPDLHFENNKYSPTKIPSYTSIPATPNPYETTARPLEFQASSSTINQYFTPTEHLGNHNVNNIFSAIDNYGSIPKPMKSKNPSLQNYKAPQKYVSNENDYSSQNQLYLLANSHKANAKPNSQNFESAESENNGILNNYQDDSNDERPQFITYSYNKKKKPEQQAQFSNYADSDLETPLNTVFSSNNHYIPSKVQSNSHNSMASSNSYYSSGKNKYTPISSPITSAYGEGTQLVNVGGNFISFDVFQNSILPLMGNNVAGLSSSLNHVEVITCATGVRQPNMTDCTRYYVCSKKDGRVLSYSCPPFTAFNSDARICDAKTYAICINDPIVPTYSVSENKRYHMESLKALQEAHRRQVLQQQQAIKAQNMANVLQHYSPSSSSTFNKPQLQLATTGEDSSEHNVLNSYMQQAASMSQSFGTTPRPQLTTPTAKKRKYYCKDGDKIADQTSVYNYFVCYKNAKGQMKGHKMTCSKGLLFCPKSTMCTLPSKCS